MNWFKIRIDDGDDGYAFVGSSVESMDTLAQRAASGHYIRLDNLLYYENGKIKEWSEWDERLTPTVLINPHQILLTMQFKADPRTMPAPGA